MTRRSTVVGAVLAGATVAAWETLRRRDARAVAADPEWLELNRPLPGRSREVQSADGTRLHVEEFGPEDAPTIVLAHGWTEALRFWHYQIRDLSRDFHVFAYDLRGHGKSGPPRDLAYTDEGLAADFDSVLTATLQPGQRCVAAGHSMGGMTIVAWAGRHPEMVRSRLAAAVLLNTGVSDFSQRLLILGEHAGARMHRLLLGPAILSPTLSFPRGINPITYRLIRRMLNSPYTSPGRVAFCHEMVLECEAPVRAGFGHLLEQLDLTESVPDLRVPAVVIAGEHDRLLPPAHSRVLAASLPQLDELIELPGVGHMAPLEAPEAVTSRLRRLATAHLAAPAALHA